MTTLHFDPQSSKIRQEIAHVILPQVKTLMLDYFEKI
jgi:hypothetical protein